MLGFMAGIDARVEEQEAMYEELDNFDHKLGLYEDYKLLDEHEEPPPPPAERAALRERRVLERSMATSDPAAARAARAPRPRSATSHRMETCCMRRVPQPRPMSALEGGRTVYDAMLESKQYQEALAMYQTVHASHARLVERMREEKKRAHMARVQTRRAELRDTLHARQATARQAALSRQEFFPLRQTQRAARVKREEAAHARERAAFIRFEGKHGTAEEKARARRERQEPDWLEERRGARCLPDVVVSAKYEYEK